MTFLLKNNYFPKQNKFGEESSLTNVPNSCHNK